ncbi:hypothetical protein SAMD00019534_093770 [Acytostelium subglobosum LB1]|uniref:hypothetical protein n=1 Tax=Acytostelium subglobosum LB1 TaxID=1410327 RepID=UPI000644F31D|nr:hypothetical protein SAMD00019534_093770 [Acytostelium subglobosum LB1]GAM26202.1 hypothetical protein SAMD00019534_093770 [Acytostelium subglobosum LB1]|eukprot:XP_012750756.1 hypothetical protein SAMD00019534_093770 [Acytostelium subglobosum LB1]
MSAATSTTTTTTTMTTTMMSNTTIKKNTMTPTKSIPILPLKSLPPLPPYSSSPQLGGSGSGSSTPNKSIEMYRKQTMLSQQQSYKQFQLQDGQPQPWRYAITPGRIRAASSVPVPLHYLSPTFHLSETTSSTPRSLSPPQFQSSPSTSSPSSPVLLSSSYNNSPSLKPINHLPSIATQNHQQHQQHHQQQHQQQWSPPQQHRSGDMGSDNGSSSPMSPSSQLRKQTFIGKLKDLIAANNNNSSIGGNNGNSVCISQTND